MQLRTDKEIDPEKVVANSTNAAEQVSSPPSVAATWQWRKKEKAGFDDINACDGYRDSLLHTLHKSSAHEHTTAGPPQSLRGNRQRGRVSLCYAKRKQQQNSKGCLIGASLFYCSACWAPLFPVFFGHLFFRPSGFPLPFIQCASYRWRAFISTHLLLCEFFANFFIPPLHTT